MIAGLTNATRLFVLTEWRKAIPYLLSPPQHTFSIFVGRVAFVNPAFCFDGMSRGHSLPFKPSPELG